jgi:hypothetical protein
MEYFYPMGYPSETDRQLSQILRSDREDSEGIHIAQISNWQSIVRQASCQRLAPLLYRRLKELKLSQAIPDDIFQVLHQQYLESAAQSMLRYHGFGRIVTALQKAHIPVIALKGVYLAVTVYKDPALRPMGDIDILIKSKDIAAAVKILQELGYEPYRNFDIETEKKYHRHLPAFIKPGMPAVEVHSSIQDPDDPFKIDVDELWQRAYSTHINQNEVMSLDVHDLLIYLCINVAFSDLFKNGLKGLYDITAVINHFQDTINWDEVYQRAIDWKAEKPVYITLFLANELLGARLPEKFIQKLRPAGFDEKVFTISKDFIFMKHNNDNPEITPELSMLIKAPSLKEKARVLFRRLFISRWEMAELYRISPNSWRIYFYYLVRLIYLLTQYIATIVGVWRGESRFTHLLGEIGDEDARSKFLLRNLIP